MGITKIFTQFSNIVDNISGSYQPTGDLEADINELSVRVVMYSAVALVLLVLVSAFAKDRFPKLKLPLFALISLVMLGTTFTLIGSTVYLNVNSESGGPIHWHADIEIWACGNEMEIRNPTGSLSNKIGTSVLHEHDDKRIHLEGVAVDKEKDASLGKFFYVIGGALTEDALVLPLTQDPEFTFEDEERTEGPVNRSPQYLNDYIVQDGANGRVLYVQDGQTCGQEVADVQTFVYRYDEATETYTQFKVENPVEYVIAEDSLVPPGDCIIVEFDVPKEKTDKLCTQYGIRDIDRCLTEFTVATENLEFCTIKQTDYNPDEDYRIYPEMEEIDEAEEMNNSEDETTEETNNENTDTSEENDV